MNQALNKLIAEVATARNRYLEEVNKLTQQQAEWKPSPNAWNVVEITEHLFWAEQGGLFGMWKIIEAHKEGKIGWTGEAIHAGLSVEDIIAKTWKEKEIVPAVAAPRLGGTIAFWSASLHSLQGILEKLGEEMNDDSLEIMTHPHPISGAMNVHQRLEFLRFHIDRHLEQVFSLQKS
jgi:hypothetical protein